MTLKFDNVKDYIFVKNVLPSDLCDQSISLLNELSWETHVWYGANRNGQYVYGENEVQGDFEFNVIHYHKKVQESILPFLKTFGEEYIDKFRYTDTILFNTCSTLRYNKYLPGKSLTSHIDHIHSLFDGGKRGIPVVSLIGALNDDFEGGKLIFWDDYEVPLKKGDIVAFPSLFMYPHKITEVTKGVRYSWVSWCY